MNLTASGVLSTRLKNDDIVNTGTLLAHVWNQVGRATNPTPTPARLDAD